MIGGWLWDRKTTDARARKILKKPGSEEFITFAALLLARKNNPKEILKQYLDPLVFCKYWASIKRRMRQDDWNSTRIVYWQAIYEHLIEKYRKKGVIFRREAPLVKEPLCRETGRQISDIRREQGLSQKNLAKKMNISQQIISRVEKGRENISLITLSNIARALDKKVEINFI